MKSVASGSLSLVHGAAHTLKSKSSLAKLRVGGHSTESRNMSKMKIYEIAKEHGQIKKDFQKQFNTYSLSNLKQTELDIKV